MYRRSNNRNFKLVAVSILLCATTCAISPAPAHAANGWEIDLNAGDEIAEASSVTITMGSGTANAMLFPESSNPNKAMAMIKRTASVTIGATDGYTIKVSGEPNLVGKNSNNKIPSITANTTLAQMNNQWGWYSAEGDVDCNTAQSLKQINSAGETISSGALSAAATKNFTMCFGAKVNTSQAADSYSGTVMVSAVAEPRSVVINKPFNGITTMQAMASDICKAAAVNDTAQLEDARDGKKYWVTKLFDGNCWMSQNLDLDLGSSVLATQNNDPTQTFTWDNASPTTKNITEGTTSNAGTYSWDLGDYVITNPAGAEMCSNNNAGLSACSEQFTNVSEKKPSADPNFYKNNGDKTYTDKEYDAHYLVGNYYQWNAATAGTGGIIKDYANASGSICPKNWRLPNGYEATNGTFKYLLAQYGVSNKLTGTSSANNYNIALSPLFFVRGGLVSRRYPDAPFRVAGHGAYYWSSRASSSTDYAYRLFFDDSYVNPIDSDTRYYGFSLRCFVPTT